MMIDDGIWNPDPLSLLKQLNQEAYLAPPKLSGRSYLRSFELIGSCSGQAMPTWPRLERTCTAGDGVVEQGLARDFAGNGLDCCCCCYGDGYGGEAVVAVVGCSCCLWGPN